MGTLNTLLILEELNIFLAINLPMEIKKMPSYRNCYTNRVALGIFLKRIKIRNFLCVL